MKQPVKNHFRRRLLIGASIGAFLLVAGLCGYYIWGVAAPHTPTNTAQSTETPPPPEPSTPQPTTIRVAAMGDMLAHDTIIANAKTKTGYDFGRYFSTIRELYSDADVVFCNQEGLSAGETYGISGYPSFNAPKEFAKGLQSGAGCNLINLANNHMGDRGAAATDTTVKLWKQLNPLAFAGANTSAAEQRTVRYATVQGVTISFLSFADFNNNRSTPAYSVNLYHDTALVRQLITEARKKSDVVIVSMHWGTEDSAVVNTDQKAQVNLLASLGVDVIIGTGPHVLQTTEVVKRPDGKKMVVWYSLGNMLSSQLNIPQLFSGIATFDIVQQPSEDGAIAIKNLGFIPTYMHYEWSAADEAAGNLLARNHVMIYPLSEAAAPLAKTRLGTTVKEQRQYIVRLLGPAVTVRDSL